MPLSATDKQSLLTFYVSQIQDDFMPYWNRFADREYGGILNCINNFGDEKLSDLKFSWSQGRYLWILGSLHTLARKGVLPRLERSDLEDQMHRTFAFVREHSLYDEGRICCYLLDREGNHLKDPNSGRYDASIFADCFVLMGICRYIRALGLTQHLPAAETLFKSIVRRIGAGEFHTEPYPVPEGYRIHSIPMILLNTTHEYIHMLQALGMDYSGERALAKEQARAILEDFYKDGFIREHMSDAQRYETHLLDRHVNPGHTLEDMWFCAEFLDEYDDLSLWLERICELSRNALKAGWDEKHGGLLRFVDRGGGPPRGVDTNGTYEKLIQDTWDMKLWWPHSEALYVLLYLYCKTSREEWLEWYGTMSDYVFRTFPNRETGEWIQIRRRDGAPEEKLVALPVKDPYHILRNYIKIVELLDTVDHSQ